MSLVQYYYELISFNHEFKSQVDHKYPQEGTITSISPSSLKQEQQE